MKRNKPKKKILSPEEQKVVDNAAQQLAEIFVMCIEQKHKKKKLN